MLLHKKILRALIALSVFSSYPVLSESLWQSHSQGGFSAGPAAGTFSISTEGAASATSSETALRAYTSLNCSGGPTAALTLNGTVTFNQGNRPIVSAISVYNILVNQAAIDPSGIQSIMVDPRASGSSIFTPSLNCFVVNCTTSNQCTGSTERNVALASA